jgi:PhoPQ-activated pathogenicity-related protein
MLKRLFSQICIAAWLLAALPTYSAPADRTAVGPRTALDRYVHAPDTNYSYRVASSVKGESSTTYRIDMISQAWLTTNEVERPIWQHWLTIVKPDKVTSSTGLLFISGGSQSTNPPTKVDPNISLLATETGTVVAELRNVPNQPTVFVGETKGRSEDSFIAYTWDKFLRTGDERWPARLPMTKAAVRALDTITAFCASDEGGKLTVDKFVVAGGSKRGWTTWTTAAVDNRVIAIAPIVIDMLNIEPSFHHHFEVYGFYAPAVKDYTTTGIMDWDGTPEYRALMKIEEPYEYRQRLTLPKFLINSSGDQFFVPDSAQSTTGSARLSPSCADCSMVYHWRSNSQRHVATCSRPARSWCAWTAIAACCGARTPRCNPASAASTTQSSGAISFCPRRSSS